MACTSTKYLLVLLCTLKLAQRNSQYYLVPQNLCNILPRTTLYRKTCTTHLSSSIYSTAKLAHGTLTQWISYTKNLVNTSLIKREPYTHRHFYEQLLYREVLRHRSFYTQKLSSWEAFTLSFYRASIYAEKLLRTHWPQKLQLQNPISAPKGRRTIMKRFFNKFLKEDDQQQAWEDSADKSPLESPSSSTQPLQYDLGVS